MNRIESKIKGMFTGAFVGDCLGMVCEGFSREKIKEEYGKITDIIPPTKKSWFEGQDAGTPTDDWQLTKAVAEAMVHEDPYSIPNQIKSHIEAFNKSTLGWGRSTRDGVKRLSEGQTWWQSGAGSTGAGNGIAMKVAPFGLLFASKHCDRKKLFRLIKGVSLMTHRNVLGLASGVVQVKAIRHCMDASPKTFSRQAFANDVYSVAKAVENRQWYSVRKWKEKLHHKLAWLSRYDEFDSDLSIKQFGGGSCYAVNSLPFSYTFFLKNPFSFESVLDVINAGGDTDTNGSIVGSLVGALNGVTVFPKRIRKKIKPEYQIEIDNLSRLFYEKFFK